MPSSGGPGAMLAPSSLRELSLRNAGKEPNCETTARPPAASDASCNCTALRCPASCFFGDVCQRGTLTPTKSQSKKYGLPAYLIRLDQPAQKSAITSWVLKPRQGIRALSLLLSLSPVATGSYPMSPSRQRASLTAVQL